MERRQRACTGSLLGFAVGDAMGYSVDDKTWPEIEETYGPNGLLGFDLLNGGTEVTSYTQVAAYVINAMLVAMGRGRDNVYLRYGTLGLRQWAKRQHFPRDPDPTPLWVARMSQLRRRRLKDARMLDALRFETLGTLSKPINRNTSPGALSCATALGLYFSPERLDPFYLGNLAAEMTALTHGSPEAMFSSVVLAYALAGIIHDPKCDLANQFIQAMDVMQERFGARYPVKVVTEPVRRAIRMAREDSGSALAAMESFGCRDAASCLAAAVYASLRYEDDFDGAMICAVNHSGASCAVGAVTGAILGAYLGEEALPEFYLESLDCAPILRQLAEDLTRGSVTAGLFDADWDHKYVQGLPLLPTEE